jgi:HAD superfamily hydrolase (TIGR01549 family)
MSAEFGTPSPAACFIFDLDGTLQDFMSLFDKVSRRVSEEMGLHFSPEKVAELEEFARSQMQGQSSRWIIVKILWQVAKRMDLSWRKRYAYIQAVGRHYRALAADIQFFPGATDALEEVRRQGFPTAIQTSASVEEIQHRMAKYPDFLTTYINFVLGRDDVPRMKPAPDGILLAAKHFNVPPSRCVYVGDMETDMQAAKAAGAVAVGVLTGFDGEDRLTAAGANFILPSVADIPGIIQDILGLIDERASTTGDQ